MPYRPHVPVAPGSTIPLEELAGGGFAQFRRMLQLTDGLSRSQVCTVSGLEPSTLQNWINRGFVARPEGKKYHARHLARILLIAALRECMPLERVGALMTLVNGNAEDESDDIVSDERLYDYLCECIRRLDAHGSEGDIPAVVEAVTADFEAGDILAAQRLRTALQVMVCAHLSNRYKREADLFFSRMQAESIH